LLPSCTIRQIVGFRSHDQRPDPNKPEGHEILSWHDILRWPSYMRLNTMPLFIVELNLKARSPLTVETGDVIVDKGCSTVTVRNVQADSVNSRIDEATVKANTFLDELCCQHGINLELENGAALEPQGSPTTRHVKKYTTKIRLKGWHRKRVPRSLKEVRTKPSDAKAYYRKAAISKDPFDRFRNLFLAIENIATKIVRDSPNAKQLLKRALQTCFPPASKDLEHFMQSHGFEHKGDAVAKATDLLYSQNRLPLFHSKENKGKKIPYKLEDEESVETVLPLAEFVAKSLLEYEDTNLLP